MLANPKYKFLEANQNKIYKNYNIKDSKGQPVRGRLEYNHAKDRLTFAYVDDNGVVQRKEVWNNQFVAQKDYKQAMLVAVGELTAAEQTALVEFGKAKTTVSERLKVRNSIISDLYTNGVKRVEEIKIRKK
jgi:hypothetical protein